MKKIDFDLAAFNLGFELLGEQQAKLRREAHAKLKELFDAAGITELEIPIDPDDDDLPVLWTDDDDMVQRIRLQTYLEGGYDFIYVTAEGDVVSDSLVSPIDAGIVALQILGE